MTLIYFVLIFGAIVLAHEFGHYLLAKVNGIHVVEFAIGMGPKLVGFHKNGTDYVIRLLPIGGACMFEGEDGLNQPEGEPSPNSFNAAPVWARISSVVAGPLFNFILAFLLALLLVGFSGSDKPVILGIMEGFPAAEAGMEPGDEIIRMNGEKIFLAREIYINTYLNGDKPMTIEYERDGERYTVELIPKYSEENGRHLIGFQGYGEAVEAKGLAIFKYAYYEVRYSLVSTLKSLAIRSVKQNTRHSQQLLQQLKTVQQSQSSATQSALVLLSTSQLQSTSLRTSIHSSQALVQMVQKQTVSKSWPATQLH